MPTLAFSDIKLLGASGTFTSASFTPQTNDIIVVKAIAADSTPTVFATPTGGGWTYTSRVTDSTASHVRGTIWTASVTTGGTAQTVSCVYTGVSVPASMVVELWRGGQLAATPATCDTRGSGAPSTVLTTTAANSVVSWLNGDWAAISGTGRTYNTTSATPTEDGFDFITSQYTAYYAYQTAATAGSQTLGITAPVGQTWTLLGIEVQDLPASAPALIPPQSSARKRRNRRQQTIPASQPSAVVTIPEIPKSVKTRLFPFKRTKTSGITTGGVASAPQADLNNTFEGGTPPAAVTNANSGGASGNAFDSVSSGTGVTFAYDSTHVMHGSVAAKVAVASPATASFAAWTLGTPVNTAWARFYVYIPANPVTSDMRLASFVQAGIATRATLVLTTSGTLSLSDPSLTPITSTTTTVPLGSWCRVEIRVTGSATSGSGEIKLFTDPDSATPTETATSAGGQNTGGVIDTLQIGVPFADGVNRSAFWIDDPGLSVTGYLGPTGIPIPKVPAPVKTPRRPVARVTSKIAPGIAVTVSTAPVPPTPARVRTPRRTPASGDRGGFTPGFTVTLAPTVPLVPQTVKTRRFPVRSKPGQITSGIAVKISVPDRVKTPRRVFTRPKSGGIAPAIVVTVAATPVPPTPASIKTPRRPFNRQKTSSITRGFIPPVTVITIPVIPDRIVTKRRPFTRTKTSGITAGYATIIVPPQLLIVPKPVKTPRRNITRQDSGGIYPGVVVTFVPPVVPVVPERVRTKIRPFNRAKTSGITAGTVVTVTVTPSPVVPPSVRTKLRPLTRAKTRGITPGYATIVFPPVPVVPATVKTPRRPFKRTKTSGIVAGNVVTIIVTPTPVVPDRVRTKLRPFKRTKTSGIITGAKPYAIIIVVPVKTRRPFLRIVRGKITGAQAPGVPVLIFYGQADASGREILITATSQGSKADDTVSSGQVADTTASNPNAPRSDTSGREIGT